MNFKEAQSKYKMVGDIILEARLKKGLSRIELVKIVGHPRISIENLTEIEHKEGFVDRESLKAIAQVLDLDETILWEYAGYEFFAQSREFLEMFPDENLFNSHPERDLQDSSSDALTMEPKKSLGVKIFGLFKKRSADTNLLPYNELRAQHCETYSKKLIEFGGVFNERKEEKYFTVGELNERGYERAESRIRSIPYNEMKNVTPLIFCFRDLCAYIHTITKGLFLSDHFISR